MYHRTVYFFAIPSASLCRTNIAFISLQPYMPSTTKGKSASTSTSIPAAVDAMMPPTALVTAATDWASIRGLQICAKATQGNALYTHLPVALLPAYFPCDVFHHAAQQSPVFGELIDRIARDRPYLEAALEEVIRSDTFTRRLLDIYRPTTDVTGQPLTQPLALGVHRSDYLLDEKEGFLQVELNTIASSFAALGELTSQLHRFLFERYLLRSSGQGMEWWEHYAQKAGVMRGQDKGQTSDDLMPPTQAVEKIAGVIHQAHLHANNSRATVIFVVQPNERNIFDQRQLEYALWDRHQVPVERLTLAQISEHCTLQPQSKHLMLHSNTHVSVVYFRAGYTPDDYPSEKEWGARDLIERSTAIKCPTVGYQLAGTKKVQQLLAQPGALKRFLPPDKEAELSTLFTGLWALDQTPESLTAVKDAIKHPHAYVLKPQREGGGNNLYDTELVQALQTWSKEELSAYILMQRIRTPERHGYLVRENEVYAGPIISEVGIFSCFLGDINNEQVFRNEYAGHIVRSKPATVNEGGVASGFACLDSVLLR